MSMCAFKSQCSFYSLSWNNHCCQHCYSYWHCSSKQNTSTGTKTLFYTKKRENMVVESSPSENEYVNSLQENTELDLLFFLELMMKAAKEWAILLLPHRCWEQHMCRTDQAVGKDQVSTWRLVTMLCGYFLCHLLDSLATATPIEKHIPVLHLHHCRSELELMHLWLLHSLDVGVNTI